MSAIGDSVRRLEIYMMDMRGEYGIFRLVDNGHSTSNR